MTLYIGAVYGGPENKGSILYNKICHLMQLVCKHRMEDKEKGSLNVVFYKTGSISKYFFSGIRTAKFSRKEKMFMIQAAIPESITQEETEDFLFASLRQAAELGKLKFQKAKIEFDSERYLELVDVVEKEYYQRE